jgi:hypothetical protein
MEFSEDETFDAARLGVSFTAVVDGSRIPCFIMAAVLCDAFGASDVSEEGLLASFRNNRRKIQHIASQKINNHRFDENSRIIIQSGQIV